MIRSGKIVILCDENQETEILGIEMNIDNIQKILVFSFVGELGSFLAVNVCPNTNDLIIKSHILERKNDNIRFCEKSENQITTGRELSVTIYGQIWSKNYTFCDKISPKGFDLSRIYSCRIAMVKFWAIKNFEKIKIWN